MLRVRGMHGPLVTLAALSVALLASRPARSDCASSGSEGYGDCLKYPACTCVPKIITCPNGGWYTQYSVDLPCGSPTPGPPPNPTTTSGEQPKSSSPECNEMKDWLQQETDMLNAYSDQSLVNQGTENGWSIGQYNNEVWRAAHDDDPLPEGGATLMSTDPYTCAIDEGDGCQALTSHGFPAAACQIARDHENVHRAQCLANQQNYQAVNRYDIGAASQREIAANRNTVSEINQWLHDNCP